MSSFYSNGAFPFAIARSADARPNSFENTITWNSLRVLSQIWWAYKKCRQTASIAYNVARTGNPDPFEPDFTLVGTMTGDITIETALTAGQRLSGYTPTDWPCGSFSGQTRSGQWTDNSTTTIGMNPPTSATEIHDDGLFLVWMRTFGLGSTPNFKSQIAEVSPGSYQTYHYFGIGLGGGSGVSVGLINQAFRAGSILTGAKLIIRSPFGVDKEIPIYMEPIDAYTTQAITGTILYDFYEFFDP